MRWEECDWSNLGSAISLRFSIAAVFGSKHQLFLRVVEVTHRPAVVAALLNFQKLLCRQILSLLRRIQFRPVLGELIASMLCRIERAVGCECESIGVSDSSRITTRRRVLL